MTQRKYGLEEIEGEYSEGDKKIGLGEEVGKEGYRKRSKKENRE